MWVLVKSGDNGILTAEAQAWAYDDYEDAIEFMYGDIAAMAADLHLSDDDYGVDEDSGHGFCGAFGGPEYQIFEV